MAYDFSIEFLQTLFDFFDAIFELINLLP